MYQNAYGVKKDSAKAVSWYRKAANQGYSTAQANLGYMYNNGIGVPKDLKKAVNWYQKAANQGDSRAEVYLGSMYEYGNGIPKDLIEAVKWYRKAATKGNDYGEWNLGTMYEQGKGVTQNYKLALSWYRKASNQGHVQAKKYLKALELKVKDIEDESIRKAEEAQAKNDKEDKSLKRAKLAYKNRDYKAAFKDFLALEGSLQSSKRKSQAQYYLGLMYENGQGVALNYDVALKWYRKSSSLDYNQQILV